MARWGWKIALRVGPATASLSGVSILEKSYRPESFTQAKAGETIPGASVVRLG